MRNRALHDALRDFSLEAAAVLVRATEEGHEIGFSLDEQAGGGGTLYRYRPLTAEFIAERWDELKALPSFEVAGRALGKGSRAYLRRRGEPGADAEPALRAMLERLYEESTSFAFPEERFERVYAGVERALYAGLVPASVAAAVSGVRLEGARVELGDELALADVALLTPAPSPAWAEAEDEGDAGSPPTVYLVLERDIASDAPLPLGEARLRFATAVTALRLLRPAGVALAPLGFARAGDGAWQAFRLDAEGRGRGAELVLGSDAAAEVRLLAEALEEGRGPGHVSWALARFEMGLARRSKGEALSDYLLAARALLGGTGVGPATVALRLAALRAAEADRRTVRERVEAAFVLEPLVVEEGIAAPHGDRHLAAVGGDGPHALVRGLEEDLRHLLADVLRGELDANLAARADEVLLKSGEPVAIRADRLPGREPADGGGPAEVGAPVAAFPARASTERAERRGCRPAGRASAPARPGEEDPTASLTLELEEDGETYSAPV